MTAKIITTNPSTMRALHHKEAPEGPATVIILPVIRIERYGPESRRRRRLLKARKESK